MPKRPLQFTVRRIKGRKILTEYKLDETPYLTIDAIIEYNRKLIIIERMHDPLGLAWVGGFVDPGETCKQAVIRECGEEVNLKVDVIDLIGIYDDPERDPRGHLVSIAYLCKAVAGTPRPQDAEVKKIHQVSLDEALKLHMIADHSQMLLDALELAVFDRRRI